MDLDPSHDARQGFMNRGSGRCWTCRLRRKKCNGRRPICDACDGLGIDCDYSATKPAWMDGGAGQEAMTERLKREVRTTTQRRRGERALRVPGERLLSRPSPNEPTLPIDTPFVTIANPKQNTDAHDESTPSSPLRDNDYRPTTCQHPLPIPPSQPDPVLTMFYLDHVLPFLFPFYHPPAPEGGRAWILHLLTTSPVVRDAVLCQSSYFFSLANGPSPTSSRCGEAAWNRVLAQTREAFRILGAALSVIDGSGVGEHVHGAVRVMTGILQVQRFEVAVRSFENCHAHLGAARELFVQLLEVVADGSAASAGARMRYEAVLVRLGPVPGAGRVPGPEQAAFRFSSALLLFDDIVASTVLRERPRLYEYHAALLSGLDGDASPPVDLASVVGCQNWVLLLIGEIAVLDVWKRSCREDGTLDVMDLVDRAKGIKCSLETRLAHLVGEAPAQGPTGDDSLLDILTADRPWCSKRRAARVPLVTRVWAHGALLYLAIVVSGWQPASPEVKSHVDQIIDLLSHETSPPALLRTMVWPFCVAGCLAESGKESQLRDMAMRLQPPSVFGTVRRALDIMENVWQNRGEEDVTSWDLAQCFRYQDDFVLLV